jgi:hypothetical protein
MCKDFKKRRQSAMTTTKALVAILALGTAVAFSPLAQAATKMKHEHKRAMHHHHRMAHSHTACHGAYMYHKGGKCMDARNKK